jgi:hypothetical protein
MLVAVVFGPDSPNCFEAVLELLKQDLLHYWNGGRGTEIQTPYGVHTVRLFAATACLDLKAVNKVLLRSTNPGFCACPFCMFLGQSQKSAHTTVYGFFRHWEERRGGILRHEGLEFTKDNGFRGRCTLYDGALPYIGVGEVRADVLPCSVV